jgi:hypothetical protein
MRKGKDPGSGSVTLTNGSGSVRPKNIRIRFWILIPFRILIRFPNTPVKKFFPLMRQLVLSHFSGFIAETEKTAQVQYRYCITHLPEILTRVL